MGFDSRLGTVLVAFLLLSSVGTAGGVYGPSGVIPEEPLEAAIGGIDATDEAEAAYVSADGGVVLAYERPHETPFEGRFGAEAGTGLAYARYSGDVDDGDGVSGAVTARVDPEAVRSSGDLRFEETGRIDDLEAEIRVEQIDETWHSSGDVSAVVTDFESDYESIRTDGDLEVTPESIVASGTADAHARGDGGERNDSLDLTVSETDAGYDLTVSERRPVEEWELERWNTREDAEDSLDTRFSNIAVGLGGSAEGSLESYRFLEDERAVEYEYDVELVGVTDHATDLGVALFEQYSGTDLDGAERTAMVDRLAAAELSEFSATVDRRGPETTVDWALELEEYDEFVLGVVESAESIDAVDDGLADRFDDVREGLETREKADLRQTVSWNVSVEGGESTTVDADWTADAENWEAYTTALADRGLEDLAPDRTATVDAETTDDAVTVVYDYETGHGGAADLGAQLEGVVPGAGELVTAVGNGAFGTTDLARVDVTVDDGSYELEGAAVDPVGAVEAFPVDDDGLAVSATYLETDGAGTTVYVVADDFVGEEPTEEAVRERQRVGPDTAVYMPGEWDREFAGVDEGWVESFLETDLEDGDVTDEGDDEGVSPAVVVALVGAVLLGLYVVGRTVGRE